MPTDIRAPRPCGRAEQQVLMFCASRPCRPQPPFSPKICSQAATSRTAGARGVRVRHHDLALVFRLQQVLPGLGLLQAELLGFGGVEADRRGPGVHADPGRVVGPLVLEVVLDLRVARGLVAFQHAFLVERHQAGRGKAPDRVGLRVGLSARRRAVMTPVKSRTHSIS